MSKLSTLERYEQLEKEVRHNQRLVDEANGRLKLLISRLQNEYGCETPRAARAYLKELYNKISTAEDNLGRALDEFEEKWRDKLNEYQDL